LSIGHVKRSRLIHRNALGPGQGRGYRLPAIAGGVHRTIPGHSRDNARTADFADPIISGVGKKEIPGTVHCNPFAIGQCGGRSGASITQKAGNAPSSGKVQDPKDIDSANAIRQVSQMLTFPAGIDGEAGGPWQSGSAGVAAIARVTVIARPAIVKILPKKIGRTRKLPKSATISGPDGAKCQISRCIEFGGDSGPPSPASPSCVVPAMVLILPDVSTWRMTLAF
jgi:hypothetical protein